MKTMAEVIMLHSPIGRDEDGQYCKGCNHRYGYAADRQLHQRASVHIEQALVASGYGPVREAKEAAWDECESAGYEIRLNTGSNSWGAVKDNPYRAAS